MKNSTRLFRGLLCIALLGGFFLGNRISWASDTLTIACIPYRPKPILQEQLAPLVELLGRKLQRKVQVVIADSYADIGERLHHQVADIGILGPKSYVEAKAKYPAIHYLATNKSPEGFYHSLILSRKDSGLRTIADLQGKSFAYTERGSTSGYLFPRQLIRRQGFNPDTLFSVSYFLNKHDKVYAAIAYGSVHAGAVSSTGMDDAVQKFGDVFLVLDSSDPIPRNALVAGPHISLPEVSKLKEILRSAEDDAIFKENSQELPNKGFWIKDDSLYDIVRRQQEVN